jgi:hypothetical protein
VKKPFNAAEKSTGCIWHLYFFVIDAALPIIYNKKTLPVNDAVKKEISIRP